MIDDPSVITAADMITQVFSNIDKEDVDNSSKLLGTWKSVVSKVHKYGERLSTHTELIELKNGILLIETDHPGWIQILQLYSKFILTGLERAVPELKISSLAFRLKGSDFSLCGKTYDEQIREDRLKLSEKLETQGRQVEIHEKTAEKRISEPVELSPELRARLDDLRKSMLTNSSK
ncbi:MAG: DUF721 domain-containing protein [Treponema sp.]|nr:DUF721 domain-containing protein [Treponema sp.]